MKKILLILLIIPYMSFAQAGYSGAYFSSKKTPLGTTWDPTAIGTFVTLSNGNLRVSFLSAFIRTARSTHKVTVGSKVFWELYIVSGAACGSNLMMGIDNGSVSTTTRLGSTATSWGTYMNGNINYYNNNVSNLLQLSICANPGDYIGFGLDLILNQLSIYKNGVLVGSPISITGGIDYYAYVGLFSSTGGLTYVVDANFSSTQPNLPFGFSAGIP